MDYREQLGFKINEGLIVKSPETGIAAKVTIQKENTYVAELINHSEIRELEEKVDSEKQMLAVS